MMLAQKKSQSPPAVASVPGGLVPINGSGNHVDVMQIMQFCFSLVEKIAGTFNKQVQTNQMPEAVLNNMYNHMQRLMFSQARDTQKMIQELRRNDDDMDDTEPIEQPNNDFAGKIIDLIKSVLPTLLNLNPVMAKAAVSMAKKTDEYRQIKGNPELQKEVIEKLKKEVGEENTETIVQQFGTHPQIRVSIPEIPGEPGFPAHQGR